MLSPGTREEHRQARRIRHRHEDTLGVRGMLHVVLSRCMRVSDPTVDCSFSSDGEDISEIHWIYDEDVPDQDVQSIAMDNESSDSRSHGNSIRICDCYKYTLVTPTGLHHIRLGQYQRAITGSWCPRPPRGGSFQEAWSE